MYQQYYVIKNPPDDFDLPFVYHMKFIMVIEIVLFYSLIITVFLFLSFIHIRGEFGYKDYELNKHRFKYDALDYYENDIEWLSFQVVPISYTIMMLLGPFS